MSAVASEYEFTAHELVARELYASRARKPATHWTPVRALERETWYDWADPATGQVGQCRLGPDGKWHQDPRGTAPVVLEYRPRQKPRAAQRASKAALQRVAAVSKSAPPKERPIIFTGESVRAIRAGTKVQTRRVLRPQPPSLEACHAGYTSYSLEPAVAKTQHVYSLNDYGKLPKEPGVFDVTGAVGFVRDACGKTEWRCPYGIAGDRLWCKEGWAPVSEQDVSDNVALDDAKRQMPWAHVCFREDGIYCHHEAPRWRSPIFMPRWASRLTLELTSVRVERLQAISEADAIAEGLRKSNDGMWFGAPHPVKGGHKVFYEAKQAFESKWNAINGKTAPWVSNPWVWALTFRALRGGQ